MKVTALLLPLIALMMSGCSRDAVQRTGYETLRNIEQQRCLEQGTTPCPKGEEYDDYQRRRQELEKPQ